MSDEGDGQKLTDKMAAVTRDLLLAEVAELAQSESDWHRMKQIWDFLRSVSQNVLKTNVKKSQIYLILGTIVMIIDDKSPGRPMSCLSCEP